MTNLYDEFNHLITALNERGIPYAVCGGWAMAIHGAPRATVDIDLLILSDSLEDVSNIAARYGYGIKGLPMTLAGGRVEIRRVSKVDSETGIVFTLDLLLVTPELIEVWEGRETVAWENGRLSVVSREGLIKLKLMGGRTQDLADIEKLKDLPDMPDEN